MLAFSPPVANPGSMIFLFRLLSRLPLGWVHALGGVLGRLTYWLSPTYGFSE